MVTIEQRLEAAERGTEAFCRAADLRDLLQHLADQIADADQRHSDALRDMQDRLARLGGDAQSMKATLPKHYAAAFERIEDGMALLAERLAEADAARSQPEAAVADRNEPLAAAHGVMPQGALSAARPEPLITFVDPMPPAFEAPMPAPSVERAEVPALRSEAQRMAAFPPPALKSALGQPLAAWFQSEPQPATLAPQEHAKTPQTDPDEPWDQHAADALARLYDSGDAGLPPVKRVSEPEALLPRAPLEPSLAAMAASAVPAPAMPGIEREWLEARLSEIAARVERSLIDLKPELSIVDLGHRFDQLEARFGSALEGVATRADVEGLRIVEAHITELTQRLEETQTQLARLDQIETQLGEISHQFNDDQIVRLFGSLIPTEQDLARFADEAADKAAARLGAAAQQGASPMPVLPVAAIEAAQSASIERIGALQQMLAGFIDERRRGEAHTSEALDTMQQAIEHVLDRVDAIDAARSAPVAAAYAAAPAFTAAPMRAPMPAFGPDRGTVAASVAAMSPPKDLAEQAKAAARTTAVASATAALAAARPTPAAAAGPHAAQASHGAALDLDADVEAAPAAAAALASKTKPVSAAESRRALIENARRAADKAKPTEEPSAAAVVPRASGMRERLLGKDGPVAKSAMRPGLLLVPSVAFLLLAGYWFLSSPKSRLAGPVAKIERIEPAAGSTPAEDGAAKASTAAPAIDSEALPAKPSTEDPAALAPAGEKPVRQRGTMRETVVDELAQTAGTERRTEAPAAVVQGPMGIMVQRSPTAPSHDQLVDAQHKARLATLSERTAQHAAQTSALTEAAIPASVREEQPAPAPAADGRTVLELPAAQVGPLSLRLAAAKGDPSAQFEVAARFAEGKGIKQDFEQAAAWYQRAATQGLAAAQYRLAALHERGLGVKADPARARVWYKRSAEQGNLKAMHNLAVLSAGRDQGSADYATAAQWFTEAAERGLADSQYNLGVLYESGLGVPKDAVAAYKWYAIAARSGDREATRRHDLLKGKLDAITLRTAEEAVAQWRPRAIEHLANDAQAAGNAWKTRAAANPG